MYGVIVIVLRAFVVQALADDLDSVGTANDALHDSLRKMTNKFVNNSISRLFKASQHCCTDLDGTTLGKHGQGHGMAPVLPKALSVPYIAHQGPVAQSMLRLPLELRASLPASERSSSREVEIPAVTIGRATVAGQLGRRAMVAGLMGGVLGTSACPCWAAREDFMQMLTEEEGTVPYLSSHLENIREQIGNIKTLVQTGDFGGAQDLLKLIEFGNLRKDVAVAQTLTLVKPGSKIFDVAEVIEPLDLAEFALSRAKTRMDSLQNNLGLPSSMTRPDDVLFNLDRLQNGIVNVEQALKSINGI